VKAEKTVRGKAAKIFFREKGSHGEPHGGAPWGGPMGSPGAWGVITAFNRFR